MNDVAPFKTCSCCGQSWETRHDFLCDPHIILLGYQEQFDAMKPGLFLFNHAGCTTLALRVTDLEGINEVSVSQENVADALAFAWGWDW